MTGRASTRLRYLYLAAAFALAAAYAFGFGLSVRPPVLLAVVVSAIALTVVAHRQGRIDRFTAVAFIGGFILFESGDLTAYEMDLRHVGPGGFPSLQDVFYFAGYPFFTAAFTRQYPRDRRSASAAVLFSVTLAAAVGFVIWAAAFSRASHSLHPTLVAATYPVLDLVLVFGVTQALAAGRLDRRAAIPWLGGTIAFFVADLGYAFVGLTGPYRGRSSCRACT